VCSSLVAGRPIPVSQGAKNRGTPMCRNRFDRGSSASTVPPLAARAHLRKTRRTRDRSSWRTVPRAVRHSRCASGASRGSEQAHGNGERGNQTARFGDSASSPEGRRLRARTGVGNAFVAGCSSSASESRSAPRSALAGHHVGNQRRQGGSATAASAQQTHQDQTTDEQPGARVWRVRGAATAVALVVGCRDPSDDRTSAPGKTGCRAKTDDRQDHGR
jgi:hypothetical protein